MVYQLQLGMLSAKNTPRFPRLMQPDIRSNVRTQTTPYVYISPPSELARLKEDDEQAHRTSRSELKTYNLSACAVSARAVLPALRLDRASGVVMR